MVPEGTGVVDSVQSQLQGIADDLTVSGKQPVSGTLAHTQFANEVRALGDSNLRAEVTYEIGPNGQLQEASYGTKGAVRLDAVLYNAEGKIEAVFDLKTGKAGLTPARIRQIQSIVGDVPVIEIRPK